MKADRRRGGFFSWLIYNAVLALASPLLLAWYLYRVFGSGKSREGWLARLGFADGKTPTNSIWFHAVSVGETVAVRPVVQAFQASAPEVPVLLSSITSTGRAMAGKVLPQVPRIYLPVDFLPSVRSVVRRVRPVCAAICESEIWPNFLNELKRSGSRVVMVNGVVSDSTLKRSARYRWLYRWALSNIDEFHMQTDEDRARIVQLGADPSRVHTSGSTKYDEAEQPLEAEAADQLRAQLGFAPGQPVLVAGSTNPGEEDVVLRAFAAARQRFPDLGLVIAPRQIERGAEISRIAAANGYAAALWSDPQRNPAPVVILDTFGMLARAYAIARVAFVGGTFIDKGGHNILQPLAQGVPVLHGPYDYKIRDVSKAATLAGVAFRASDEAELSALLIDRLNEPPGHLRAAALGFISSNRGASDRCAEAVLRLAREAMSERQPLVG